MITTRLLVHAMVREDGTVDADELYTIAGALGMTDQQVRLCIKRLVAEGRFTHEGRGRRAVLRTTADITGAIAPETGYVRYAYRQDRGEAPWDGTWHLLAFAIPESARAARDSLRDTILRLGAAAIQGGLYVTANPVAPHVEAAARQLGVLGSLTVLTTRDLRLGEHRDPATLAARLWPLDDIAERYDRLAALARAGLDRLGDTAPLAETDQLVIALELAAEFTDAMNPDPLLPPELLPQPWSGTHARHLAALCWTRLLERGPEATGGARPRLFRLYADVIREAAHP
ncbi:PaaX family transcriptional regulator C-terminal domain-containing protein [Actinoplanes siamensis]|uniref:Repressor in the phenylacetic acid catabolism n=1 Tax=Actinoplanes siamensis TaxID=1223317 RepID=A0A919K7Z5_9ACTN|nr:PaaX family transcriptional regulator C-terminal domain-containing protein [Actinoplanes siamensis]GIF02646.1 putative repressor in the phenylacetic acid catabolism [Actinoplanes siamensis]